ncbi:MAG: LuxR family transcriptional regulator, partial [Mycobacterium sp.]
MNPRAMVSRLNELDEQLCSAFGIERSVDATTLDEAITMSATTTEQLVARERGARDHAGSAVGQSPLTDFLQAQVAARQMRASDRADVVRSLTAGIRRMKKAGSLQGLGRQACTELCEVLGFD